MKHLSIFLSLFTVAVVCSRSPAIGSCDIAEEAKPDWDFKEINNFVLTKSTVDINNDGRVKFLEIILDKGCEHFDDPSFKSSVEIGGQFSVRVLANDGTVLSSQSLNEIVEKNKKDIFFSKGHNETLHFVDYNDDGRKDFLFSKQLWTYHHGTKILTIHPDGKVSELPFFNDAKDFDGWLEISGDITKENGFIKCPWWATGSGFGGYSLYKWDGKSFVFVKNEPPN